MRIKYNIYLIFVLLTLNFSHLYSQEGQATISGFIKDASTGEVLIGTNILLYQDSIDTRTAPFRGAASNRYGFYAIPNIPIGTYMIIFRNIGYQTLTSKVDVTVASGTVRYNVDMKSEDYRLDEIVVKGEREDQVKISTVSISPELLSQLPSMSGGTDLFRSLVMLPGVSAATELSNGLYVRGGSPDQTLTLVDNMMVYNPAHLGNFASTFDENALQDIKLIKGGFPAEYGGRLSSVLDIKLRNGTKDKEKGNIGIGMINSNFTLEGPLFGNATYMISGRGMYYDIIQKTINKEGQVPRYNFYDLSAKFSYLLTETDILSISGFFSKDHLYNPTNAEDINYDISWQNGAVNINWLDINSESLFSNTTLSFINYKTNSLIANDQEISTAQDYFASSKLQDIVIRRTLESYWHEDHVLKGGLEIYFHNYNLLASKFYSYFLELDSESRTEINSIELSAYVQNQTQFGARLKTNIGGRLYYVPTNKLFSFDPRISLSYALFENLSFKASFSVAHQFLHLISRNDISLPTDLWYPSTEGIAPSKSTQVIFGSEISFDNQIYVLTVEGYYRDMKNILEFKENATFDIFDSIEDFFTPGEGEAYGIEFFINKRAGTFTGWLGYTLSWTRRKFIDLNLGRVFYPRYDRRHDISAVVTYNASENLSFGLTWVYSSGQKMTLPAGQYQYPNFVLNNDQNIYLHYAERNAYQLPDYHKLDINMTYKFRLFDNRAQFYINIFNVYNRKNAFSQYVTYNDTGDQLILKQITLFPFIPTIGINVKF
ncbi:carboxypeptidase regulatory-like domain-containing protein [Bacteroidota bacterium]